MNNFIFLLCIVCIIWAFTEPDEPLDKVDLPEELPIAKRGDTLVFYNIKDTQHVAFYHKNCKYPTKHKLYVIK